MVNKAFRDFMFSTLPGRFAWLRTASLITGYEGNSVIDIRVSDFQYQLKLLVCPWLSKAVPMQFKFPKSHAGYNKKLDTIGQSRLLLRLTAIGGRINEDVNETNPKVFSFSSIPCKSDEAFSKTVKTLPNSSIITFYDTMDRYREFPAMCMDITPSSQYKTMFNEKSINRSTFAVIEAMNENHCMGRFSGGVYFVSKRNPRNPQILRFMAFNSMDHFVDLDICSAPQKLWLLTSREILYFGPHLHETVLACDEATSAAGRMMPAICSAYNGDVQGAIRYMKVDLHGTCINTKSMFMGRTVLHYAVYQDNAEHIRELVLAKADVNQMDDFKVTPLMMAASYASPQCITALCECGADINLPGAEGKTPLLCIGKGSPDKIDANTIRSTLDAIIKSGANLNHEDINCRTILFDFSVVINPETLRMLVSNGAYPHHIDNEGNTLLHVYFAKNPGTQCNGLSNILVEELGIDINAKNGFGLTTLTLNVFMLSLEEISHVVNDLKADITIEDDDGATAYDSFKSWRVHCKDYKEICKILRG
jgi:hypothetical protein